MNTNVILLRPSAKPAGGGGGEFLTSCQQISYMTLRVRESNDQTVNLPGYVSQFLSHTHLLPPPVMHRDVSGRMGQLSAPIFHRSVRAQTGDCS